MTGSEPNPEEVFDVERIRQLVELMEEHGLSEIDLKHLQQRIRLRRGNELSSVVAPVAAPLPPVAVPTSEPTVQTTQRNEDDENIVLIKSPMVGTFYNKPNPEADTFVKVGDHVASDTTVCIIEAMKVFNEIPAETSGTIISVLVENEEAVEFGRPLFKVDTSK